MNLLTPFKKYALAGLLSACILGLSGCSTTALSDGATSTKTSTPSHAKSRSKYRDKASYVVRGKRYYVLKNTKGYDKTGTATWYGPHFHGKPTSSDERYNMYGMTAASTTLPFHTHVRVTNLENGRTAIVKINDRGPFNASYIIDLSYAAAKKLGYAHKGTARVRVTAIEEGTLLAENSLPSSFKKRLTT
jgi:rare lipoprotein A